MTLVHLSFSVSRMISVRVDEVVLAAVAAEEVAAAQAPTR
jgi:hypothetical protein